LSTSRTVWKSEKKPGRMTNDANPKETRNPKSELASFRKQKAQRSGNYSDFVIRISFGFRHSSFGFPQGGYFFTNSAKDAVCPCKKFFSPTGPISPLQKKPAKPSGPNRCCTISASWFGRPIDCVRARCNSTDTRHRPSRPRGGVACAPAIPPCPHWPRRLSGAGTARLRCAKIAAPLRRSPSARVTLSPFLNVICARRSWE